VRYGETTKKLSLASGEVAHWNGELASVGEAKTKNP
jgi:hypothetical protein